MPAFNPDGRLASLGERLPLIRERFDEHGVLGLLLVDADFLGEVERQHGTEGHTRVRHALAEVLDEVARERLLEQDLVVLGEPGRHEVLVLLFRRPGDAGFYRQELPGFGETLRRQAAERSRLFYPFLRRPPLLETGAAMALRNPKLSVDTQLRGCLEEGRDDAELNSRKRQRRDRRQFIELLLDQRVHSVYEPIVDVSSRTVFGYEALARGPEGSEYHSPLGFFGAAEREGFVFELDCLCRQSALKGAIDFPEDTKLFINLLPTAIHDPNFRAERLVRTLEECRLSPSDLVLEISEQESIDNFAIFKEMRDAYRSFGFQFALDDTGSGYAGLEAMLELSPEFIKVDRAFVSGVDQDPSRQELLGAILRLAERAGAQVIGEGLDTIEELEMLGELGIHFGQGWLFGHPTPLRAR